MNSIPVKLCLLILCVVSLQVNAQPDQVSIPENEVGEEHPKTLSSFVSDFIKPVAAEPYWYVQVSVYTTHYKSKSEHNNNQELIGLERHTENSYLLGAATFLHSYHHRSWYGYAGKRFDFEGTPFYSKVTAGLLYGYNGDYRDKIPLNRFEIAPVIIPSVGIKYRRVSAEVVLLGVAAAMVNIGFEL